MTSTTGTITDTRAETETALPITASDAFTLITSPEENRETLDQLPFKYRQAVYVLRHGFDLFTRETKQRQHLESLVRGKDVRPAVVLIDDLVVLGSSDVDPDIPTDAIFTAQRGRDGDRLWRILAGGKLSAWVADSRAQAMLMWLEAEHNDGRIDQASTYAARVLNIPTNE